ncbi:MAG: ATP phosphoribosyltransferase [Chloroflexota bacterium]|nr:ATP phosphoribosyltransferase [Chloroflexota bacterium]
MTMPLDPSRIRLAAPNKGRMLEPTTALLRDSGLSFESTSRALVAHADDFPLDILFVRTEDVIEFVGDGVADLGITGTNLLAEAGAELPVLLELGYGRCRLEAAVPTDSAAREFGDLAGMRLATSHPRTARRSFDERGIPVEIVSISGAVEVAPRMGLADGVVDLVSTGSTLVMNGLRSVGALLASEAILVSGPRPPGAHTEAIDDLVTMLRSVVAGRRRKYLMMNAPRDALGLIEALLPGLESPSVIPLAHEGMVAVHAVVATDEVWGLLPRLRAAGASGILVLPVEKLVP